MMTWVARAGPFEQPPDLQRLDLGLPVRRVPALVPNRLPRDEETGHAEQDDQKRYGGASGASGAKSAMSSRVHTLGIIRRRRRARDGLRVGGPPRSQAAWASAPR
jgi:hypothetical protein